MKGYRQAIINKMNLDLYNILKIRGLNEERV
jgi:hypothetical protein